MKSQNIVGRICFMNDTTSIVKINGELVALPVVTIKENIPNYYIEQNSSMVDPISLEYFNTYENKLIDSLDVYHNFGLINDSFLKGSIRLFIGKNEVYVDDVEMYKIGNGITHRFTYVKDKDEFYGFDFSDLIKSSFKGETYYLTYINGRIEHNQYHIIINWKFHY